MTPAIKAALAAAPPTKSADELAKMADIAWENLASQNSMGVANAITNDDLGNGQTTCKPVPPQVNHIKTRPISDLEAQIKQMQASIEEMSKMMNSMQAKVAQPQQSQQSISSNRQRYQTRGNPNSMTQSQPQQYSNQQMAGQRQYYSNQQIGGQPQYPGNQEIGGRPQYNQTQNMHQGYENNPYTSSYPQNGSYPRRDNNVDQTRNIEPRQFFNGSPAPRMSGLCYYHEFFGARAKNCDTEICQWFRNMWPPTMNIQHPNY